MTSPLSTPTRRHRPQNSSAFCAARLLGGGLGWYVAAPVKDAEGPRIRLWLNGTLTVDYTEKDDKIERTGIVGLQIHGGAKAKVLYKDILLEDLAPKKKPAQASAEFFKSDKVIEINIDCPCLPKLPIYARMGVPEVWRYDGAGLAILALVGGTYHERDESVALPGLDCATLSGFMQDSKSLRRPEWGRKVRDWVQRQGR